MSAATVQPRAAWWPPELRGLPWVTWRQHRVALAGIVALLGGLGVLLLVNGLAMHSDYTKLGLNSCGNVIGPACQEPFTVFHRRYGTWVSYLPRIMEFIPALIGVFLGAPLVARELESGTFRFAWTQGRSRVQWIATKLALLATLVTILALAFSFLFSWWYQPWLAIAGRMQPGDAYEVTGLVFTARTLFGFMLGALLGTLIRRTVPAMAATAAAWLAVVWPSVIYLRPLIEKPITARAGPKSDIPTSWQVDTWFENAAGHRLSQSQVFNLFTPSSNGAEPIDFGARLAKLHYTDWVSYQPASRFWHFQTVEASTYVVVALLLAVGTVLWLRRRAV